MPAPSQYPLANYIPALQKLEGLTAASALRFARGEVTGMNQEHLATLRASDLSFLEGMGGVRSQNFYWQWGAVEKNYALRDRLASARLDHIPTAEEITQGRYPRARGYQYNVDVLVRDLRSGVEHFTPMGVVSDTLISHAEAMSQAANNLRTIQGNVHMAGNRDTLPFQILNGAYVTDVIERLPELDDIE